MRKLIAMILAISVLLSVTVAFGAGGWVCPVCGNVNYDSFCPKDGTAKPVGQASSFIQPGDYVFFGQYPQTRSGTDNTQIEWLVLECNNNQALLISRYALDCQKYGNSRSRSITWENSSIRNWLNSTFLAKAFSSNERACIQQTWVSCDSSQSGGSWSKGSGGSTTLDYVFLLSRSEADYYFGSDYDRRCAPTDYAISRGASTSSKEYTKDGMKSGFWWLRTQGNINYSAAIVHTDGKLHRANYYDASDNGVRPVIWVDISSIGRATTNSNSQRYNYSETTQSSNNKGNRNRDTFYPFTQPKEMRVKVGETDLFTEPTTFATSESLRMFMEGDTFTVIGTYIDINGLEWCVIQGGGYMDSGALEEVN